jgi:hypothetical protein
VPREGGGSGREQLEALVVAAEKVREVPCRPGAHRRRVQG